MAGKVENMKFFDMLTDSKTRIAAGYILLGLLLLQLFVLNLLPKEMQPLLHEISLTIIILVLGLTLIKWQKILIPLLVTLVVMEYISKFIDAEIFNSIVMLLNIVILDLIIGLYILQTYREQKVNTSVILQSINGYLLLVVISSLLIAIILKYDTGAFAFPDVYDITNIRLGEAQYLGLVTITTLGYGDIFPLTPIARSVTTFIAVEGQLYIAIIIALLVGKFSSKK